QWSDRRRARARQEPHDRRRGLCQRQPAGHGAVVRRLARDRRHRRAGAHLARAHQGDQRRCAARGCASLARQAPLGDRLSGQGNGPGGEALVSAAAFRRCAVPHLLVALIVALVLGFFAPAARAMTVEGVVSPGGIEAWLVSDHTLPLIVVDFAILGSANQDPADKPGVANLATSLLDEGAGPFDATAFHARLEGKAIELNFRAARDYLRGTLQTLKDNRDEAFDYLRLALTEPRFDAEAVERMRAQILSRLRRDSVSPNDLASRNWWATAFPGHPYGRPVNGTLESVQSITVDDLKSYTRRVLARDTLKIAIVGDIDAETAVALLDRTF